VHGSGGRNRGLGLALLSAFAFGGSGVAAKPLIDAGLDSETKAVTAGGSPPGGTFVTQISTALPETEVNGAGEIVEIESG